MISIGLVAAHGVAPAQINSQVNASVYPTAPQYKSLVVETVFPYSVAQFTPAVAVTPITAAEKMAR